MENYIKLNEPAILDVIVENGVASILITTSNESTDELKVKLNKDNYERLVLEFGDTSNIGFGGTDNWGKDRQPLYLDKEAGSRVYDGVFVDNLTIQQYAGEGNWCKCERLENGALKYTAVKANTSPSSRVAYFKHSSTDKILKAGFNKGRKVAKEWYVTVIQYGVNDTPHEEEDGPELQITLHRQ